MRDMKKKSNSPLTKYMLYRNAIKPGAIGTAYFAIGFWLLLQFVAFFAPNSPYSWYESIILGLFLVLFWYCLIVGIASISPLHGIFRLIRQEKVLNFSFVDEMNNINININNTTYSSYQWFIHALDTTVLAFHRDYIQEIKEVKDPNGRKFRLVMTLITVDGKKIKVQGLYKNITKLEQWFLQEKEGCASTNP